MPSAVDCSSLVGSMGTTCCCNGLMVLSVTYTCAQGEDVILWESRTCASLIWTCQTQMLISHQTTAHHARSWTRQCQMSPLAALIASLNINRDEPQPVPQDAARFTDMVCRRLADSDMFAQTVQQLTSRDVQVTCSMQAIHRSSVQHDIRRCRCFPVLAAHRSTCVCKRADNTRHDCCCPTGRSL